MTKNSVAPKERINITYKTKTNNQEADVELPLKLMVMANLTGRNDTPVEDREVVSINKIKAQDKLSGFSLIIFSKI